MSLLICSDLHGAFNTLLRLLNKCPKELVNSDDLVFLGDLIDRGPNSKQVVEFTTNEGVRTCAANHEDLAMAFHNTKPNCSAWYDNGVWLENGGCDTLTSFGQDPYRGRLPDSILNWMANLPIYIIDKRYPNLLLSHTGHAKIKAQPSDMNNRFNALWNRNHQFKADGYYRILGHTPELEPIMKDNYSMIDTGAAYASRGYGVMTAMIWPSKEIIQQPYDETPFRTTVQV